MCALCTVFRSLSSFPKGGGAGRRGQGALCRQHGRRPALVLLPGQRSILPGCTSPRPPGHAHLSALRLLPGHRFNLAIAFYFTALL